MPIIFYPGHVQETGRDIAWSAPAYDPAADRLVAFWLCCANAQQQPGSASTHYASWSVPGALRWNPLHGPLGDSPLIPILTGARSAVTTVSAQAPMTRWAWLAWIEQSNQVTVRSGNLNTIHSDRPVLDRTVEGERCTMRVHHRIPRWLLVHLLVALVIPLLACNVAGLTAGRPPRWACPSPTPRPYGEAGPVKREWTECVTDPITGALHCETNREYYAIWEQEYAHLGGPPFPAPTPYGIVGTSYSFGQRVEIWPVHVTVTARPGPLVTLAGVPAGAQQIFSIAITWINHTAEAIPKVLGLSEAVAAALMVWLDAAQVLVAPIRPDDRWRRPRPLATTDLDQIAACLVATPVPSAMAIQAAYGEDR